MSAPRITEALLALANERNIPFEAAPAEAPALEVEAADAQAEQFGGGQHGGRHRDAVIAGHPNRPTPWVWYAPTLPALPEARESWMFERFLAAGIAVAGVDVRGSDRADLASVQHEGDGFHPLVKVGVGVKRPPAVYLLRPGKPVG